MSEFAGFDLDRNTERAWSRFRARLADHIAEMADDDILVVSVDSAVDDDEDEEGAAPYVQFRAWGETLVRSEVSGGNEFLTAELQLDDAASGTVVGLGWAEPTGTREGSANFYVDVERAQADRLAVMTTQVLRDVFGVPHPAFLAADGLGDDAEDDTGLPVGSATADDESLEAPAVFPRDREHLLSLVDDALTPIFGQPPEHDEDDDIPVVSGTALVFVRVLERMPTIQLFCFLVHDVVHPDRTAFEVSVLNRDKRFLKFVLVGDSVMAQLHLPAYPFAPEHLRTMLAMMSEAVDEIDDDLVARVGGRRTFEPESPVAVEDADLELLLDSEERREVEAGTEATHPAMMTLLQLDAESPGSITPELAASVCSGDRDLILELITWNSDQEIAWRQARDHAALSGDSDEADVCDHETRHAEGMVNILRRALRLIVEQKMGRERTSFEYGGGPGRPTSMRRPEPDAALPGLDVPVDEPGLFDEG